jgi:hypothetical protein
MRPPESAIELMIRHPPSELIERRAMWLPTERFQSSDPFLHDLRVGAECGFFPVYLGNIPSSDSVESCGAVRVSFGNALLEGAQCSVAARWKRGLQKMTMLDGREAQQALYDIPDILCGRDTPCDNDGHLQAEIHLFKFKKSGKLLVHPAILVLDDECR